MVQIVFRDHLLHRGKNGLVYEITTHEGAVPIDEASEYEAITVYKRDDGRCYVKYSPAALEKSDLLKDNLSVREAIEYARSQAYRMDSNVPTDGDGVLSETKVDLHSDL